MRSSTSAIFSKFGVNNPKELFHAARRTGYWKHTGRSSERAFSKIPSMEAQPDYRSWSNEKLVERVTQLENELKLKSLSLRPSSPERNRPKNPRVERIFDPSKYSTRLVAFKLAYLGKRYNGYEYHPNNKTPLPTIEEELWKAFNKARLIFPRGGTNPVDPDEIDWEGMEYSKCGRTDKGVSAFGQVIGIRVRSNRPLEKRKPSETQGEGDDESHSPISLNGYAAASSPEGRSSSQEDDDSVLEFDPIADEIPYCSLLNRLLPPDIRILAWCPSPPPNFSARFSCEERQYRYFFTQPAFAPTAHNLEPPRHPNQKDETTKMKDGWLNIDAMRKAARLFEGLHDFRNFCKVDGGKQIENFERRIFKADIEEVSDSTTSLNYLNSEAFLPPDLSAGYPKVYTFTLHGSAFLWHQVRCMLAILFLVAQGLEKPEIVSELLDVEKNPRRPIYEMASDTPLVLWDCVFPQSTDTSRTDAVSWIHVGSAPDGTGYLKYGTDGLMENLWKVWRERKIDELLASTLIGVVSAQGKEAGELNNGRAAPGARSQKVFDGGNKPKLQGLYTSVMRKERMESVKIINEKYAKRKGFESAEDMKVQGFRRLGGKGVNVAANEEKDEIGDVKSKTEEEADGVKKP